MKFVDTNVFAYVIDKTDPQKQGIAKALLAKILSPGSDYGISVQVLSEFASVALRKCASQKVLSPICFPFSGEFPVLI